MSEIKLNTIIENVKDELESINTTYDNTEKNIEQEWGNLEKVRQYLDLEKDKLNNEKEKLNNEKEKLNNEKINFQKDRIKLEKKIGVHLFNSTVKKMFDDEDFVKSLDEKVCEITKDGKIDSKDIPDLMLIVLEVTNNLNKFNLTYDEILKVLEEFIIYIIENKNLVEEKNKEEVNRIIKTVVKLTMARPVVSKWFKKIFDKLKFKLLCC